MGEILTEFERIIAEKKRENQFTSYKQFNNENESKHSWLKSICAFLNTNDGRLYLGLGENKDKLPDKMVPIKQDRDQIRAIMVGNIDPQISGQLFEIKMEILGEGKGNIFIIDVKKSQQRPHAYDGRFWHRRDDEDVKMDIEQIKKAIYEAQAKELLLAEIKRNESTLLKISKMAEGYITIGQLRATVRFLCPQLETTAWQFLWDQGLVATVGQNLTQLQSIYAKAQKINTVIRISQEAVHVSLWTENNVSDFLPKQLQELTIDLRAEILRYLTEVERKTNVDAFSNQIEPVVKLPGQV